MTRRIAVHVTELRRIQEELAIPGSLVSDEDFLLLIISSLPKSWDNFTSAYLYCCQYTVAFRSIRPAIWGVTTLTNRTFRMTPWDMCDLGFLFRFYPFFDPNLGKFRVT
jgi:hypothetical protein